MCIPMMSETPQRVNIGVLTIPILDSGVVPLSNLVDVLKPLSSNLYLLTGGAGYSGLKKDGDISIREIVPERGVTLPGRILKYIWSQLRISYELVRMRRDVDIWFFFFGGDLLVFPLLAARVLKKKVILILPASTVKFLEYEKESLSRTMIGILSNIGCSLSTIIVLYAKELIRETSLERFEDKIRIAPRHFLDFGKFEVRKRLDKRGNLVGYLGRLSEEKGVLNFVEAIHIISKEGRDVYFSICGDGDIRDTIEEFILQRGLRDEVEMRRWIQHSQVPDYLNDLRLIVLPSFTEGLPNAMLEAMACGTPVLATPVGAIPMSIRDEKTGFIMEDNAPLSIARNIVRALCHPDLEEIAMNARAYVQREFSFEAAVRRYERILSDLGR